MEAPLINHIIIFQFDIIITERVLINLLSPKDQENALYNISKALVPGGSYLMIESFIEPLMKINKIRRENYWEMRLSNLSIISI